MSAKVKLPWFKSNVAHYSLVSFPLVLEFCGRIVIRCFLLQVKCLETTARWSGVSAPTAFTCTASWNGWTRSKCSSNAPCADRNGSLRSERVEHSCLISLVNYSVFVYLFVGRLWNRTVDGFNTCLNLKQSLALSFVCLFASVPVNSSFLRKWCHFV